MARAGAFFGNGFGCNTVCQKIAAHLRSVVGGERDFREQIVRSASRNLREFDLLMRIYGKAWARVAKTTDGPAGQSQDPAIEFARSIEIRCVQAYVGNAGYFWTCRLIFCGERQCHEAQHARN
jgi:hypothetical protein